MGFWCGGRERVVLIFANGQHCSRNLGILSSRKFSSTVSSGDHRERIGRQISSSGVVIQGRPGLLKDRPQVPLMKALERSMIVQELEHLRLI